MSRLSMTNRNAKGEDAVSDTDLFEDLTTWHEEFLVNAENRARLRVAARAIAWAELKIRYGPARPVGADRKSALAQCAAARDRITDMLADLRTWVLCDEAESLLGEAVDVGAVAYHLGAPGEEAFDHVREIRAGRRSGITANFYLAALVESGRLVPATAARCVKCGIAAPLASLDAFTSPTSGKRLYACHLPSPTPEDRLGLGPWLCSIDTWGEPCFTRFSKALGGNVRDGRPFPAIRRKRDRSPGEEGPS
jgi:hypothetical protein